MQGVVKVYRGRTAAFFKNADIELEHVQRDVEKLLTPGPRVVKKRRRFFRWWFPVDKRQQTPSAKKVVKNAMGEARNLNHNYVGTEHLLPDCCEKLIAQRRRFWRKWA